MMKTKILKRLACSFAATALFAFGSSAFAASTWNFGTINTSPNSVVNPGGNKCSSTGGTQTDVQSGSGTAYVNVGNVQTCASNNTAASVKATGWSTSGAGSTYAKAGLPQYGTNGFGVQNATKGTTGTTGTNDYSDPQHSMDNTVNGVDGILLQFGADTILDSVGLGWSNTDTDISLFAYQGGHAGDTTNIAGLTIAQILTKGWILVGDYANLATTSNPTSADASVVAPNKVNSQGVSSSWWLVSAYAGSTNTSKGLSAGDDYMKVLAVASRDPSHNDTPEPGSLALMGIAIAGVVATRRRKSKTM